MPVSQKEIADLVRSHPDASDEEIARMARSRSQGGLKATLGRAWDWANKPLIDLPEVQNPIGNFGLSVLEGFTSPLGAALTLASGGGYGAARAGAFGLSKALRAAEAAGSGLYGVHGAYKAATGDTLAERGFGALEGVLGGVGARMGAKPISVNAIAKSRATTPEKYTAMVDDILRTTAKKGGSTTNARGGNLIGKDLYAVGGVAPGMVLKPTATDAQKRLALQKFVERRKDALSNADNSLGTWVDPDTGKTYYDVSQTVGKQTALDSAVQRGEKSIFGLKLKDTIDTPETIAFSHRSAQPGLSRLDPAFHGTGYPDAANARKSAWRDQWVDRSYVTPEGGAVEPDIASLPNVYTGRVAKSAVYDGAADPDGLIAQAREAAKQVYGPSGLAGPPENLVRNVFERLVKERGYKGLRYGGGDSMMLFEDTPVSLGALERYPDENVRKFSSRMRHKGQVAPNMDALIDESVRRFGTHHTPEDIDRIKRIYRYHKTGFGAVPDVLMNDAGNSEFVPPVAGSWLAPSVTPAHINIGSGTLNEGAHELQHWGQLLRLGYDDFMELVEKSDEALKNRDINFFGPESKQLIDALNRMDTKALPGVAQHGGVPGRVPIGQALYEMKPLENAANARTWFDNFRAMSEQRGQGILPTFMSTFKERAKEALLRANRQGLTHWDAMGEPLPPVLQKMDDEARLIRETVENAPVTQGELFGADELEAARNAYDRAVIRTPTRGGKVLTKNRESVRNVPDPLLDRDYIERRRNTILDFVDRAEQRKRQADQMNRIRRLAGRSLGAVDIGQLSPGHRGLIDTLVAEREQFPHMASNQANKGLPTVESLGRILLAGDVGTKVPSKAIPLPENIPGVIQNERRPLNEVLLIGERGPYLNPQARERVRRIDQYAQENLNPEEISWEDKWKKLFPSLSEAAEFAGVVGATSPRVQLRPNIRDSVAMTLLKRMGVDIDSMVDWENEVIRPFGYPDNGFNIGVAKTKIPNFLKALRGEPLGTSWPGKTDELRKGMMGDLGAFPWDQHIARAMGLNNDAPGTNTQYWLLKKAWEQMAKELGQPDVFPAMARVWSGQKHGTAYHEPGLNALLNSIASGVPEFFKGYTPRNEREFFEMLNAVNDAMGMNKKPWLPPQ